MSEFQEPTILLFLIPLVGLAIYRLIQLFKYKIPFPRQEVSLDHVESSRSNTVSILKEMFPYLRYLALAFIILSAASPGEKRYFLPDEKRGIDIMLALDVSGSMIQSTDFLPKNRLTVSKELLDVFIEKRINDRLGLVVFAGAAYLQSPLTNDLDAIQEVVKDIATDSIEEQGTAIGDAILLATYRLKSSKTKSKIIIMLTDGVSNTGKIDPMTASETARAFGIKIYTIGVGKEEGEYEVNFDALGDIAKRSGGIFYRAASPQELKSVLDEIDLLEKDILADRPKEIIESNYRNYLYLAILLLILDIGGRAYAFRFYP